MSKIQINGDLTQNSKNGNNPVTLNITGGGVSGGGSVSSGFIFDTSAIQLKADKISVRKSSSNTPVAIENIAIPTTDYQAANKKYVDDAISNGGSSSSTHLGRLKFSVGGGNIYLDIIEMDEGYLLSLNALMATISSKTNANETLTLDDPPNLKGFNGMLPLCAGNVNNITSTIITIGYSDGTWSITPANNSALSGASGNGSRFVYKSSITAPN